MSDGFIIGKNHIGRETAKRLGIEMFFGDYSLKEAGKYIFVCEEMKTLEDGSRTRANLEGIISGHRGNHIYIFRSFVPQGTCEYMSLTYNVMCACVPFIDDDKVIVIGSDFTPARNGVKDTFYSDFKGRKILTNASTAEYIGEIMNVVRS